MQRLGRQVADAVAGHLASLRDQRVLTNGLPTATRQRIAAPPDETPVSFDHLLQTLQTDVFSYSARESHPRFMAYVPGCPSFPAVMGDWLATGYNFFAGVWPVAEGPNAVELAVLEWFRQTGRGYQTRMNNVLRAFVESRRRMRQFDRRRAQPGHGASVRPGDRRRNRLGGLVTASNHTVNSIRLRQEAPPSGQRRRLGECDAQP